MLRRLYRQRAVLSGGIIVLALLMKLLVPAGYMVGGSADALRIVPCRGFVPANPVVAAPMHAMPGMAHHPDKPEHDGGEQPCAFAALVLPALAGADPALLATAILFIVAVLVRVAAAPSAAVPSFLRPPLRGPPILS